MTPLPNLIKYIYVRVYLWAFDSVSLINLPLFTPRLPCYDNEALSSKHCDLLVYVLQAFFFFLRDVSYIPGPLNSYKF